MVTMQEMAHYAVYKFQQVVHPDVYKILLSGILTVGFFFLGHLYTDALIAIVMLIIIDTALGVVATYYEKQIISQSRFVNLLYKAIIYLTSISAGYFADLTIPFDFIQATMIAFVGVTEFISILENIGRLGYATPKKLLNDLREKQSTY